jgi:uncharacterized protein (DUF362 family)
MALKRDSFYTLSSSIEFQGPSRSRLETLADPATVGIAHTPHVPGTPNSARGLAAVRTLIESAIEQSRCDLVSLVKDKTVLIKPNLVRPHIAPNCNTTTDTRVVKAMATITRDAGAKRILVGENPGCGLSSRYAFRTSGLKKTLDRLGIEICYLDRAEMVRVINSRGRVFRDVILPKPILDADVIISLPKLKTHMHTLISVGIKNLCGLIIDEQRLIFHRQDINQKIVDLLHLVTPDLTVVDAIWPTEGQAPLFGKPIEDFNCIVAGQDVVSVDVICAQLMGINPREVAMIRLADFEGHGQGDPDKICVEGTPVDELKRSFERPVISSAGCFQNIISIEGGACSGCLSSLRHSLDRLSYDGILERIPPLTVYVGKPMPNQSSLEAWEGQLWLFGNCSVEISLKNNGNLSPSNFLQGCPPHVFDFYKRIRNKHSKLLTNSTQNG